MHSSQNVYKIFKISKQYRLDEFNYLVPDNGEGRMDYREGEIV